MILLSDHAAVNYGCILTGLVLVALAIHGITLTITVRQAEKRQIEAIYNACVTQPREAP
jgi:hypothetical protein